MALASTDLDLVQISGPKRATSNLRNAVTSAKLTSDTDSSSELTIEYTDPEWATLSGGLVDLGLTASLSGLTFVVAQLEAGESDAGIGGVTLHCRSAGLVALKKQRVGPLTMMNASPTDFVVKECRAVGLKVIAQPSPVQAQISRDVPPGTSAAAVPQTPVTIPTRADVGLAATTDTDVGSSPAGAIATAVQAGNQSASLLPRFIPAGGPKIIWVGALGDNEGLMQEHLDHLHVAMGIGWAGVVEMAKRSGLPYHVGSTVRPGANDWHGRGMAVDFPGYNQDALARYFASLPGVLELIHRTATGDYAIFGGKAGAAGQITSAIPSAAAAAPTVHEVKDASSWTTFQRLAEEIGYICFEAINTVFFGQPTWLVQHATTVIDAPYRAGKANDVLTIPKYNKKLDTKEATIETTVLVDTPFAVLPGAAVQTTGVPLFNGRFMITRTTYDLLDVLHRVEIEAAVPIDPAPKPATTTVGAAGIATGIGTAGPGVAGAQAYAQGQLARFGWGPEQWPPLQILWTRESGWNSQATNPSSGAFGIPQALPGSKMASAGADWRTNAATQITWGLGYIRERYGSPAAAWAFWQAHNWY
jgi:hypothetical protein